MFVVFERVANYVCVEWVIRVLLSKIDRCTIDYVD